MSTQSRQSPRSSRAVPLEALDLPCCCPFDHRAAAVLTSLAGLLIYAGWTVALILTYHCECPLRLHRDVLCLPLCRYKGLANPL